MHACSPLGHAAVEAGHRARYFVATDLVETLYRGLADNSVGRLIDGLLCADLILLDELGFAPLDATGGQLLFRFVAAAYEQRSLGVASHSPFNEWGREEVCRSSRTEGPRVRTSVGQNCGL